MNKLKKLILNNIVHDEAYCRKVIPHIKPSYFDGEYRIVYDLILDFVREYNKLPNSTALNIEFDNSEYTVRSDINEIRSLIGTLDSKFEHNNNDDWLLESTEKWCKDRAIQIAIMDSIGIIDGSSPDKSEGMIPDLLTKALAVSFDSNVGHDYFENALDRFEKYHLKEDRIAFDIDKLNLITKGGVPRKSLSVLLAGTGAGKSLTMCHFASANLLQGKNVLYITMEMSEEKIAERIDANLFDIDISKIDTMSRSRFVDKVDKINAKTHGKLIIKEYPTAAAHAGHFRALLDELNMKKQFKPDVIFIDYLNICASSRMKGMGGSINSYTYIKAIAEELRGLAVEFNVALWSATQVTRSGYGSSDIEITDTSESFGLPASCDLLLALMSDEQLEGLNQLMIKQLKNRYNDVSMNKKFVVGIDRSKMRLYDVEDSAQTLTQDSPHKATKDFSSLKM
jgi:replicative DNA helicase